MNSDRITKQIVIGTLCAMAGAMVATVCALALRQLPIPVEVKDLTTYVIGVLSGMLIKTGVDNALGEGEPVNVTASEPLPVENVSSDEPESAATVRRDPLSKTVSK